MAATTEPVGGNPALLARTHTPARHAEAQRRMAHAIRAIAARHAATVSSDVQDIPSDVPGFDGMAGMADVATVLWSQFLKFDAADPRWPDRDRFVLSDGHDRLLLHALLHLTGHDGIFLDDVAHPGIEIAGGVPGQGLATAVGMALAERMLAARFGRSLVDHRTWVIAGARDLMEGISHEAGSLAGQLRLEKLTVIGQDGAGAAEREDSLKRFATYGWAVKRVDGGDCAQVAAALALAMRAKKPTLIVVRAPEPGPRAFANGAAHGKGDGALLAMDADATLDDSILDWRRAGQRGAASRRGWLKRLARHPRRADFERAATGRLPETFHEIVAALKAELAATRADISTHDAFRRAFAALATAMPELIGGSSDPSGGDFVPAAGLVTPVAPGNFAGRFVPYGQRGHGMAAALNGAALHGGLIPCGVTRAAFTDALRPALRLAAIMRQRVIYIVAPDGVRGGADGGSHLPVEQLAGLRAMPNLHLFRPADAVETAECWELALRRADGPSLLALSRQALPSPRSDITENRCARGGYVLAEADGPRHATLIASGPEVALALAARDALAGEGIGAAVVSLPCWELFARQDEDYRAAILGGVPRIGIEAASGFGWERWLGQDGAFIGISGFGASGGGEDLYKQHGMTQDAVAALVRRRLGEGFGSRKD